MGKERARLYRDAMVVVQYGSSEPSWESWSQSIGLREFFVSGDLGSLRGVHHHSHGISVEALMRRAKHKVAKAYRRPRVARDRPM